MAWVERYVSVSGAGTHDGTSEANAWTLAEAITNVAAGHRVNVKAGTYANTTTNRDFSVDGTTTAPIWWRGYNSTIGDLDDVPNSSSRPSITFTTGHLIGSGDYQIFSNLNITGAGNSYAQLFVTGNHVHIHRCRVEDTNATFHGRAAAFNGTNTFASECWFKCTSTGDYVFEFGGSNGVLLGCTFEGGASGGVRCQNFQNNVIAFCIFNNCGGDGITNTANSFNFLVALNCTFYSPASDGIALAGVMGMGVIAGCIFSECGAYGITQNSGGNLAEVMRLRNLFHSNTSGNENGFGDSPSLHQQTDSSSPFVDPGNDDFTPVSSSNAVDNGVPGEFEV